MGITGRIVSLCEEQTYDFAAHYFSLTEYTDFDAFAAQVRKRKFNDNVVHTREYLHDSSCSVYVTADDLKSAMREW